MNRSVDEAALDVAIERLTHFHPGHQIFIFGPEGAPFWSRFRPDAAALEARSGRGEAPLTFQRASGAFIAFILDAEERLFALVPTKSSRGSLPRPTGACEPRVRGMSSA